MAFIEVDTQEKQGGSPDLHTINTGFIYKIFPDKKRENRSIISYNYDCDVWDSINESYTSLVKRVREAEEGPEILEENNADTDSL